MADELFELKTQFYLGNYQGAINEANQVKPKTEEKRLERSVFLYRALIAQRKYNTVISEIADSAAPPALRAVKLLAQYHQAPARRAAVAEELKQLLASNFEPTVALMAATVLHLERNFDDTLRALHNVNTLESQALQVQTYLRLSRLDLAKKQLQAMKSAEDDATLTQLTEAWVNIFLGGEKTQEAFYIFQELAEKHSVTVKLLNGKAVCHIHSGRFEEAEDLLMEALERNNSDEETLANLVVVGRHRGKADDVITRYISQIRETDPNHPLVQEQDRCEKLFADAAKNFAPSRS